MDHPPANPRPTPLESHERREAQARAFRRNQVLGMLILAVAIVVWWLIHTNPAWIFPAGWWRP